MAGPWSSARIWLCNNLNSFLIFSGLLKNSRHYRRQNSEGGLLKGNSKGLLKEYRRTTEGIQMDY
eukprot:6480951-Amphidinium_carterae.1